MHEYTEQIQRWEDQLKAGDWVRCGPSELDKAIIVTLARKLKRYGGEEGWHQRALPKDPLGPRAESLINS